MKQSLTKEQRTEKRQELRRLETLMRRVDAASSKMQNAHFEEAAARQAQMRAYLLYVRRWGPK